MGRTISEKILARHATGQDVRPGQYIIADIDMVVLSEGLSLVLDEFNSIGSGKVFDPARMMIAPCQTTPNKDLDAGRHSLRTKLFAQEQGITNYFEVGRGGIMHVVCAEKGLVHPGDLLVGSDSHSCTNGALGAFCVSLGLGFAPALATGDVWLKVPSSARIDLQGKLGKWVGAKDIMLHLITTYGSDGFLYQAMEFHGPLLAELSQSERFVLCNMAVEAGAKTGIVSPDSVTREYLTGRSARAFEPVLADPDADYAQKLTIDVTGLEPQVALPGNPSNGVPVTSVDATPVDQVFIGSCSNGRIEDLRISAGVLKGRRVHPRVRVVLLPGSHEVFVQAAKEGLIEIFAEAGVAVGPAGCGPCAGLNLGVLGDGEVAVSTANRNFAGRMGPPSSKVYLANPAVAAASAVAGRIVSPDAL